MNQQQAKSVLEKAQQITTLNFEPIINALYPGNTELQSIQLPNMSLAEFINLSKKIFLQFVSHFQNRDATIVLPYVYTHPQYGNAQLDIQVQNYFTFLQSNNINSAEQILLWLAAYQLEYDFYAKEREQSRDITLRNITKLSEELNLLSQSLTNKENELSTLFAQVKTRSEEMETFTRQKKEELATITNNLSTSTTQTNQVSQLLNQATQHATSIKNLLDQQEQNKTSFDKHLKDIQQLYETTNKTLNDNIHTITLQIHTFNSQVETNQAHLEFIESKRGFFEERITYLQNLIGREVGASLFETFKQRKTELEKPLRFWRWAVPVMSIATVAWIFFLFSNQSQITQIHLWWEAFAVNTLKSIPAIFLLLFSINQYRKERNFQEEYAFKSAVALTIDAYAGRLQDPSNKDKLIMESVLSVYRTPIEEKQADKIKSKALMETVKSITETSRDLIKGAK